MRRIVLVIHNVRSALNVGSLLRTADGLGVEKVYLTGYTPFPAGGKDDKRLPHIAAKADRQIAKTALDAQKYIVWEHLEQINPLINELKAQGYEIAALEQSPGSIKLNEYKPGDKITLIVGNEIDGIDPKILDIADVILEIPMYGQKESYNVAAAGAMALFYLRLPG